MSPQKKFKIIHNLKWCKDCGICVVVCPVKVFQMNKFQKLEIVSEKKCIGCKMCEEHCPDFALEIKEEKSE